MCSEICRTFRIKMLFPSSRHMSEVVESPSLKIEAGCSSETPKNCYQTARRQSQDTVHLKAQC